MFPEIATHLLALESGLYGQNLGREQARNPRGRSFRSPIEHGLASTRGRGSSPRIRLGSWLNKSFQVNLNVAWTGHS